MDPASATISIVSFGFTVFNRVNEVRKAIKAAPEQLQALQESCLVIDLYLNKLQAAQTLTLSRTTKEMAYLDLLCRRARHHLEQVDHALNNVLVHSSRGGEIKARSLNRFRWFLMKNDLEGISRKVKESQDALGMMLEFMHSNYLRFIAASINDVQCHPLFMSSPPCETAHIVDEDPPHGRSILQCLPNCKCRCHNSSFSHLISSTLTHYLGQILLSKRLLHAPWSSRSLCNVQTCRGDLQQPLQIIWLLPRGFLHVHAYLQTTILMNYPIKLSVVCMRRSISWSAPIWDAITRADLYGVRTLLSTGKTSVWDANPEGWTVFAYACYRWQRHPSEKGLQIIRSFVEAGAEAVLFFETQYYYSPHDWLVLGLFKCFLTDSGGGTRNLNSTSKSYASLLRTSSTPIDVFRSILNMDPIDALEDYLSRTHRQSSSSDCNIQRLLNVLQIPQSNLQARSTIFRFLLQMTPLQYAIDFSPMDVRTLLFSELSNGCTKGSNLQAEGPLLVYAIGAGNIGLIKPLVDAGVDVNQKYTNGETALHVICHRCYYACLREIVRWAGDKIDWGMCTPGGRNALELFEESVAAGRGKGLSKKQVDEFGAILKNHIGYERMELSEESRTSLSMPGAFPCNIVGLEA